MKSVSKFYVSSTFSSIIGSKRTNILDEGGERVGQERKVIEDTEGVSQRLRHVCALYASASGSGNEANFTMESLTTSTILVLI
jgi:hypothetical protein